MSSTEATDDRRSETALPDQWACRATARMRLMVGSLTCRGVSSGPRIFGWRIRCPRRRLVMLDPGQAARVRVLEDPRSATSSHVLPTGAGRLTRPALLIWHATRVMRSPASDTTWSRALRASCRGWSTVPTCPERRAGPGRGRQSPCPLPCARNDGCFHPCE